MAYGITPRTKRMLEEFETAVRELAVDHTQTGRRERYNAAKQALVTRVTEVEIRMQKLRKARLLVLDFIDDFEDEFAAEAEAEGTPVKGG